jgi:dihydrofolate reductase
MRRLIVLMHVSLDGFVAGPAGEMDWINLDDELFDFVGKFTDQSDTALYGRVTYQMMQSYWPTAGEKKGASKHDIEHSRWYNTVAKIVLSRTIHETNLTNTTILSDNISQQISKIKRDAGRNILMFGSPGAAHALTQHDLIDDYWLFVNPILLGEGIPMFAEIKGRKPLRSVETRTFPSGVVGLHYELKSIK